MSKIAKTIAVFGVVAGLGVAALPLSSYATDGTTHTTDSGPVRVSATVDNSISITTDTSEVNFGSISADDGVKVKSVAVTVAAQGGDGTYELKARTVNGSGAMTPNGQDTGQEANGKIPALTGGSFAEVAGWGVGINDGGDTTWQGLNSTAKTLKSGTNGNAEGGDLTNVLFGVQVDSSTSEGTYYTDVVFTATYTAED